MPSDLIRGWRPVLLRDKHEAFARRSCSDKKTTPESDSRHRRRDELLKSRTAGELGEPAFEMPQLRFADAFDAEPAPCIGAERDIGDREIVAFDEASRRQLGVDDAPLHGFRVGILL